MSASPTPEPTKSPLRPDAPEVTQVLALSGFPEFARQFAAAVDANDTQFFIDKAYFRTPDCPSPGEPRTPTFCVGMGAPPTGPGIVIGTWNSEGDTVSADYYEGFVAERLSAERAPDAYVYALGEPKGGLEQGPSEVGLVVAYAGFPLAQPGSPTPRPETALAFRIDFIGGEWRIVGVDNAATPLVPYFFDWYAPWGDVFPPG